MCSLIGRLLLKLILTTGSTTRKYTEKTSHSIHSIHFRLVIDSKEFIISLTRKNSTALAHLIIRGAKNPNTRFGSFTHSSRALHYTLFHHFLQREWICADILPEAKSLLSHANVLVKDPRTVASLIALSELNVKTFIFVIVSYKVAQSDMGADIFTRVDG